MDPPALNSSLRAFGRLWGLAAIAHVIANFAQPDLPTAVGLVNLAVGLTGIWLVVMPRRALLLGLAGLIVVSLVLEMPITGNHWLLAGLVSAAILVTGAKETKLFPTARWILLVFYSFAAFAKINTGFFDPEVSCAVFFAIQSLRSWGLPVIAADGALAPLIIWATAAIELAIVPLLLFRRTRYWGVVVGSLFHALISFDLAQHFYDFTAVLLPLFGLFLPETTLGTIRLAPEVLPDLIKRALASVAAVACALLVLTASLPLTEWSFLLLTTGPFLLWIPFAFLWLRWLFRLRPRPFAIAWRTGLGGAVVVALAVANGLTPYTEIKTAYGFNMYANLVTAQGESNHLLITRTWPLRKGYEGPVEIISSNDPGLLSYRDSGYRIAYPQFQRYLAANRGVVVTYLRNGVETRVEESATTPSSPWWWRFFPLRALDTRIPPRCQDVFLPAL
jgi:hypothetical protein